MVGHSLGANVAIEMVAAGEFAGPLVLLSPSFSREDESKFPRALDHLGRVLGHLPYALMLKIIGPAMKNSLPPHRRDVLIAELRKNDPRFLRRQTLRYLEYLDIWLARAATLRFGRAGLGRVRRPRRHRTQEYGCEQAKRCVSDNE